MNAPFWSANKVREVFLNYFIEEHQHLLVQGSKVVPENDPTLLFTNAGMNQFKDRFLGKASTSCNLGKLTRAVNSQKCIRAGGKHNDLDDVGRDTYHHTFFEMLGSWSFDDYFKKEAIPMAWVLLTERFGIAPERLYVTVFEGSMEHGLREDTESREIWEKLVPKERIVYGGMKDNFWEMGDTGPCGRATEIHYDMLGGRDASTLVNKDDPTVVELWNLVFVEFNRELDGKLQPLPVKHVDTGMGLERLVAVLQSKNSNYNTDLWKPIFKKIQSTSKFPFSYEDDCPDDEKYQTDANVAYRVVADHIRTLTVAIVDGAVPDSIGRGYVLRRIIRRAMRFGHEFLKAPEGFLIPLVDSVKESLGVYFPELNDELRLKKVRTILKEEEKAFSKTYKVGLQHFTNILEDLSITNKKPSKIISGADAFVLHDRYGFPVDLTLLMAKEKGVSVDVDGFEKEKIRIKAENAEKKDIQRDFLDNYAIYDLENNTIHGTIDQTKYFMEGTAKTIGKVLRIYSPKDKQWIPNVTKGSSVVGIILDLTSFYAESGGQIYDTGSLVHLTDSSDVFLVQEVQKFADYVVHIGTVASGTISLGENLYCHVDEERRQSIRSNHTMTHILNHRLRECLQYDHEEKFTEINQKGSFVGSALLRFDFSWNGKLTLADLEKLEKSMQQDIKKDLKVFSKEIALTDAVNVASLRAVFDEKYGKNVRMVTVGISVEEIESDPLNFDKLKNFSIELCGGTHVQSTSSIKDVIIQSEESLTKGVRRIVCLTGSEAMESKKQGDQLHADYLSIKASASISKDNHLESNLSELDKKLKSLSKLRDQLNSSLVPLITKVILREELNNDIEGVISDRKRILSKMIHDVCAFGESIVTTLEKDIEYLVQVVVDTFGLQRDAMIKLHDIIHTSLPSIPIMIIFFCKQSQRGMVLASSPDSRKIDASVWVKHTVGKGGGKPTLAQGGFQGDLEEFLHRAHEKVKGSTSLTSNHLPSGT